jgi:hypothetical protein
LTGKPTYGHEFRELLVCALYDGKSLEWKVVGDPSRPKLVNSSGLLAVPALGVRLPAHGATVSLYPVDVTWNADILGSFPLLVCSQMPATTRCWGNATVQRRTAPMTIEVKFPGGKLERLPFAMGGVVPGETVFVHTASRRVLGRLPMGSARMFDPDEPFALRVISPLPSGGALVADPSSVRGLLTTDQRLNPGDRVPAVQIDLKTRGPVWAAVGTPLPR